MEAMEKYINQSDIKQVFDHFHNLLKNINIIIIDWYNIRFYYNSASMDKDAYDTEKLLFT